MFSHRRKVRIEWGDCDAAGIVYFPRYFEMFDTSTHHLFEAAGWKKASLREKFDMVGYPMVDTRAKFLLPSSFGDDIVIETRIAALRNSSFDIEHRVWKWRGRGARHRGVRHARLGGAAPRGSEAAQGAQDPG